MADTATTPVFRMKFPSPMRAALVLSLALICFSPMPPARAGQPEAQATAILTAGVWRIESRAGTQDRVFSADGTTTLDGGRGAPAKWRIDSLHVTLVYPDHEDVLSLPVDPNGMAGKDGKGMDMAAHMLRLNRPQKTAAPETGTDATADLLTTGKWHFAAADGTASDLTFHANGIVVMDDPRTMGEWATAGDVLVITFPSHAEMVSLPLDPKGTKVQGPRGASYIATQIEPEAPARRPKPIAATIATPTPRHPWKQRHPPPHRHNPRLRRRRKLWMTP